MQMWTGRKSVLEDEVGKVDAISGSDHKKTSLPAKSARWCPVIWE